MKEVYSRTLVAVAAIGFSDTAAAPTFSRGGDFVTFLTVFISGMGVYLGYFVSFDILIWKDNIELGPLNQWALVVQEWFPLPGILDENAMLRFAR